MREVKYWCILKLSEWIFAKTLGVESETAFEKHIINLDYTAIVLLVDPPIHYLIKALPNT